MPPAVKLAAATGARPALDPDVIAREIVEDLEAALQRFAAWSRWGPSDIDLNPQAEAAMKKLRLVSLTAGIVLGVALAASAGQPSKAELMKRAKITKEEAEQKK